MTPMRRGPIVVLVGAFAFAATSCSGTDFAGLGDELDATPPDTTTGDGELEASPDDAIADLTVEASFEAPDPGDAIDVAEASDETPPTDVAAETVDETPMPDAVVEIGLETSDSALDAGDGDTADDAIVVEEVAPDVTVTEAADVTLTDVADVTVTEVADDVAPDAIAPDVAPETSTVFPSAAGSVTCESSKLCTGQSCCGGVFGLTWQCGPVVGVCARDFACDEKVDCPGAQVCCTGKDLLGTITSASCKDSCGSDLQLCSSTPECADKSKACKAYSPPNASRSIGACQ